MCSYNPEIYLHLNWHYLDLILVTANMFFVKLQYIKHGDLKTGPITNVITCNKKQLFVSNL